MLVIYRHLLALVCLTTLFTLDTVAQDKKKNDVALRNYNAIAAQQNSGNYKRAAVRWKEFLEKYKTYERIDRVHYSLGLCYLQTKKFPEAVASFRVVLTKYPKSDKVPGSQYNLAMSLFQLASASNKPDDFKVAATEFANAATKFPKYRYADRAIYFQGEALYRVKDLPGAIAAYKSLIAKFAKSPLAADAFYALGTTQQEAKLEAEAIKTYQTFLANAAFAKHSLQPEIRLRLGMSLFAQKKFPEADKLFGEVAAVDKFEHADFAMLQQAQCRVETAKHAEAAKIVDDMLKKFTKSPYKTAAQLVQGKCQFLLKQFDKVLPPLQQVVQVGKEEAPEAAYWLGRAYLELEKPADALKILEPVVQKNPKGEFAPFLQLTRIDALYELPARRRETPKLYSDFFAKNAGHELAPQAQYMAAFASLGVKDFATARATAGAFLANAKLAKHQLVHVVMFIAAESHVLAVETDKKADLNQARQLYEQLITKHPNHERAPRALVRICWCQYQAKQYDLAIESLTTTLGKLKDAAHKAETQLLIGRSHSGAGRDKEAVTAYTAALAAKADWNRADEVLIAAAQSQRKLKNPAAAIQSLQQLRTKYTKSEFRPLATYQLGEIAQEQKKYDEAIARYNEVVEQFAQTEFAAPAAYGLGASYFAKNDYKNTVTALSQLLTKHAKSTVAPRAHYLRGLAYQRQSQFAPAANDLQAFLATKPVGDELVDAQYAIALCQIGLKQFGPAAMSLATLINANPAYKHADKVYYEMGHALREAKKPSDAANAFRTLATKLPDSPLAPESWFHVGRSHEEAGDVKKVEAEKAAELAKAAEAFGNGLKVAKAPELREKLQYKLGDMLFRQEKFAEATTALQTQIKEHAKGELLGAGTFLAAESLFRQNKFAEALPLFDQVIAKKVKDFHAQSLYRAGICGNNLKNWPLGQKHFTALIAAFPKFELVEDAKYGIGWSLQNQNNTAEALKIYLELEDSSSEAAAKARFMRGEISFGAKKYEDAIEHFLFVAVSYPYKEWQAMARFEAGRCFSELGQKDQAIKSLQVVVDKFPDHPRAKDAASLITNLKK